MLKQSPFKSLDARSEQRRLRNAPTKSVALVIEELVTVGTPAEFLAKERVLHPTCATNRCREGFAVELRREPLISVFVVSSTTNGPGRS